MKKLLLLIATALVPLAGLTVVLTARYVPVEWSVPAADDVAIPSGAAERLAGAIRLRTISAEDPAAFDAAAFADLHRYLQRAFPRVHSHLRREMVATHSVLYTWPGSDPALKAILLVGHMDVVPVEPGTEEKWQEEPFGGRISNGYVWGRGAIDNKSTVMGTLEAVEMLLGDEFRPARTVYLAYGHDEEVGGTGGAREIAAVLARRGVELEMVLDEGGVIGDGVLPGIASPVALVGIAEKGFVTLELSARARGGHSSLPPRERAVGIVSAAVAKLDERQMPARLDGPTQELFDRIGPRLPLAQRAAFANLWLTRPLVTRQLESRPATNAMVRTTTAPTMFQAGTKDNVLPSHAKAVINVRILPGDSIASVVEHTRRVVDDARVEVKVGGRFSAEPSAVSSPTSAAFRSLERTILSVAPDVVVAPYLVVVVTDARHYSGLGSNIFRFLPLRLTPGDLERMHGVNERIGIRDYESAIRAYRQIIIDGSRGREGRGAPGRSSESLSRLPEAGSSGWPPAAVDARERRSIRRSTTLPVARAATASHRIHNPSRSCNACGPGSGSRSDGR
jgi:carboxypeptidase PM20D1